MSLTSWIAKRQTKEIIKGIIQAVRELIDELLTSKDDLMNTKRKDTTTINHVPDCVKQPTGNHFPTKNELEQGTTPNGGATNYKVTKDKSHDILMGRR